MTEIPPKPAGGIYASASTVDIQNSIVRDNDTFTGGSGGGIYAAFGSTLTLLNSQVYSNSAYRGGGLALEGVLNAHIEHSEFYSNTASGIGGGIYNISTFDFPVNPLTLQDSSLHDNFAGFSGGAISSSSTLILLRTVLDANHASYKGGGIYIVPSSNATLSFQESTLSRNTAQYGGAIEIEGSSPTHPLKLVNSTLSGNIASHDGGGIYAINGAKVLLYNTTIAGNVLSRGHLQQNLLRGGGVFITDTAIITAQNALIADNYYTDNLVHSNPDDCFATVTSLHSLGFNLIETTDNCLVSGTTFGNITGLDPNLGLLAYNGGPTPTRALRSGSPAIDTGQTPSCTDPTGTPLLTDQRGFVRPNGPRCDVGAFEYYTIFSSFSPLLQR